MSKIETVQELRLQLNALLADDSLDFDKLNEAAGNLLPRIHDAMLELERAALSAKTEAQPVARWALVRESVLDVGYGDDVRTGGKPELGYALIPELPTFASADEASQARKEMDLPLGWVVIELSRLLPDVYTAPLPQQESQLLVAAESACKKMETYPVTVNHWKTVLLPAAKKLRAAIAASKESAS